jgi:triphosphoribosyl-dephospho-CoA synthase
MSVPERKLERLAGWATIDNSACSALLEELDLHWKPGLVSPLGQGSHHDMNAATFRASVAALQGYFGAQAQFGACAAPFEVLRQRGLQAEQAMLAATGGVNTHRGAIFTLGLLAAAMGFLLHRGRSLTMASLSVCIGGLWGAQLAQGDGLDPNSHGQRASQRHLLGGARAAGAMGFQVLRDAIFPHLVGCGEESRLDALAASIAVLDDTNLVHRGGMEGLRWAQAEARRFLRSGGTISAGWEGRAQRMAAAFEERRLSPGGSADMLAAACFVRRVQSATIT